MKTTFKEKLSKNYRAAIELYMFKQHHVVSDWITDVRFDLGGFSVHYNDEEGHNKSEVILYQNRIWKKCVDFICGHTPDISNSCANVSAAITRIKTHMLKTEGNVDVNFIAERCDAILESINNIVKTIKD